MHICEVCGRSVAWPSKLEEHLRIHTGERPHKCGECKQSFRTKPDLVRHARLHSGERPFSCTICARRFHRSDYIRAHMKAHRDHSGRFSCQCGKQFDQMHLLARHRDMEHRESAPVSRQDDLLSAAGVTGTGSPATVTVTSVSITTPAVTVTTTSARRRSWVSNPRPRRSPRSQRNASRIFDDDSNKQSTSYDRELKGKEIPSQSHTIVQLQDEVAPTTTTSTSSTSSTTTTTTSTTTTTTKKGQYSCNDCGNMFFQKGGLAMHLKLVHGVLFRAIPTTVSAMCPTLSVSSPCTLGSTSYKEHEEEVVLESRTASQCSVCGQLFSSISQLTVHQSMEHTTRTTTSSDEVQSVGLKEGHIISDKDLNVDDAYMDSDDNDETWRIEVDSEAEGVEVDAHMNDANPATQAVMKDCVGDASLVMATDMVRKAIVPDCSETTGAEKPFRCEDCGRCFSWSQDLNCHTVMSHSWQVPYHCMVCGQGFLQQNRFSFHMRAHKSKAIHTCEHCTKSFTAASSLREHKRIHSGEKPYHCDHCGKDFRQKCVLTRHIKNVHRMNLITDRNTTIGSNTQTNVVQIVREDNDIYEVNSNDSKPVKFSPSSKLDTTTEEDMVKVDTVEDGLEGSKSCMVHYSETKLDENEELSPPCMTSHDAKSICQQHAYPKTCTTDVRHVIIKQEPTNSSPLSPAVVEVIIKQEENLHTFAKPSDGSDNDNKALQGNQPHMKSQANGFNVPSHSNLASSPLDSRKYIPLKCKLPIKCSLCGLAFAMQEELNKHTDLHVKSEPFFCNFCSDTFRTTATLGEHVKAHVNIIKGLKAKEFVDAASKGGLTCNICCKQLEEGAQLSEHMQTHCPNHGSSACLCSMYESSFQVQRLVNENSSLEQASDNPVRVDSSIPPYGCNFCLQPFKTLYLLLVHLKTHFMCKPFACNVCRKAFSQKKCLKQHKRMHANDCPYMCAVCGESFRQKTQLRIHEHLHINGC